MRTGKRLIFDNIWKYISVVIVALFVWSAVYENLSQTNGNQRITIAVYNIECDTQTLHDDLWIRLPELTKQDVLELYVDDLTHIPNQTYASDILMAQILQSDLVIMPASLLAKLDASAYFTDISGVLSIKEGYYQNNVQYGIMILANSRFNTYCTGDEPYYLFFNCNSVNLGGLFEKGQLEDDAAMRIFEYLIEVVQ